MALAAAFNVDVIDLTVNAQSQEQITVYKKRANTMAAARLSFWISLASYVFGMILFAVLSVGDGSRGYVMLWPSIWWTVAMAGHGLTVIIVLLVMRYHNQQDGFTG
ncbi:hypothetical protein MNBD_ALPHA06-1956 [hydrothermal vent metagenome]|uniref:2TM domain-containing protein n=1 Tax=hydrothermal vent metagenome TaxID=652676 RepID=A0A3B0S8I1_9ZZZZ